MKMSRVGAPYVLLILLGIAAVVVVARGWARAEGRGYATERARRMDLEEAIDAVGILEAKQQVEIGAQVGGQVKTILVKLGQPVRKGQLLGEIDPSIQKNALEQEKAKLDYLSAQHRGRMIRLEQLRRQSQRQRELRLLDSNIVQDAEVAEMEFRTFRADTLALEAQIRQQRLMVATAETNLSYTRIVAPIDGDVVEIVVREGQTVVSSFQIPTLLTIADRSTLTVRALVSEADLRKLEVGQRAHFSVLGNTERQYDGRLRVIEPKPVRINNAVFFNALLDVGNAGRDLALGTTAQVAIVRRDVTNALVVPLASCRALKNDSTCVVEVVQGSGKAVENRTIHIGMTNALYAQVLKGVKDGDEVVVRP